MNTQTFRMKTNKDLLPLQVEGQSFINYINANNGGRTQVYGYIGQSGSKNHSFDAFYIQHNGENIIVSIDSTCGAQSFKSHLGADLTLDKSNVNCSKCCKKIN
jgi:aspartate 1-decarboxylase